MMFDIEDILENTTAFKAQSTIREDAFQSLKYGKELKEISAVLAAGKFRANLAVSPAVASMIGVKTGFSSFLGIGSFVTPLPYVALAALGSAGAYIGTM